MDDGPFRLRRTATPETLPDDARPVGLDGVLARLDGRAALAGVPGRAAAEGFRWPAPDQDDRRWWPQGVACSGEDDASPYGDRDLLLVGWYAKDAAGRNQGSRVTVVDLAGEQPRYRHVTLVDLAEGDGHGWQPLRIHAGGLAWHGHHLFAAATRSGVAELDLRRVLETRRGLVLPVSARWAAEQTEGTTPLRYSFLSGGASAGVPALVVGEYGRGGGATRLVRFPFDAAGSVPKATADGVVTSAGLPVTGPEGMQGAVLLDGTWCVTTSAGRWLHGTLHRGDGSRRWRRRRWALPTGVEDLSAWPARQQLWSLSEHPGRRWVFAIPFDALP